MAIKEKDLQTIEQLSDGDKLRVVTAEGNSKNIDANSLNDIIIATLAYDGTNYTCNKTYQEILDMLEVGKNVFIRYEYIMDSSLYETFCTTVRFSTGYLYVCYVNNNAGLVVLQCDSDNIWSRSYTPLT